MGKSKYLEIKEKLYRAIDQYGMDYEKIIELDKLLHEEIINIQKKINK